MEGLCVGLGERALHEPPVTPRLTRRQEARHGDGGRVEDVGAEEGHCRAESAVGAQRVDERRRVLLEVGGAVVGGGEVEEGERRALVQGLLRLVVRGLPTPPACATLARVTKAGFKRLEDAPACCVLAWGPAAGSAQDDDLLDDQNASRAREGGMKVEIDVVVGGTRSGGDRDLGALPSSAEEAPVARG